MKKILLTVAVAIMTAMNALAQKIEVVDTDGNGIPLVSVMTEDGVFIGKTDLNGVLADVKGAQKLGLSHVAYKPQMVTVASLAEGQRITMEDAASLISSNAASASATSTASIQSPALRIRTSMTNFFIIETRPSVS